MNYPELIRERRSIREFANTEILDEQRSELTTYFYKECGRMDKDLAVELAIVNEEDDFAGDLLEGSVGIKGHALHAPIYLIILCEESPYKLYQGGYMAMDMMLKLQDMGLGSCFLTAPNGETVKRCLNIKSDKACVAVIAAGIPKRERPELRLDMNSQSDVKVVEVDNKRPPRLSEEDILWWEKVGQKVENWSYVPKDIDRALMCAALSPSYMNRQPYRFLIVGKYMLILSREDEFTTESDVKIDVGIAMRSYVASYETNQEADGMWKMGVPEDLPDIGDTSEYKPVAYCNLIGF